MSPRHPLAVVAVALVGAAVAGAAVLGPDALSPLTASSPDTTAVTAPPRPASTSSAPPATTQATPPTTVATTTTTVDDGTLRPGDDGPEVLALQQQLHGLGYWLGTPDGSYGHVTQQAVMAFQKASGLGRDGLAGPVTLAAVQRARRPAPRAAVDGVEIDLARQIILVIEGGQVRWVLNTSTGTAGWETPPGAFAVQRAVDGVRHAPLGDLYRPRYFHGGIAVHGSSSIPSYPASHGCTRVSNAAMDMLWASGHLAIGSPVRVY